jgi:hypothetical protein
MGESILVKREVALIVWNEEQHIERFVRTAAFDGSARSFGFLVPTPGRPTLAETSEEVLLSLYRLTAPDDVVVNDLEIDPTLSLISFYFGADRGGPPRAVNVLEEVRVAGLDATVLAASDAEALSEWLRARGFEQREALKHWLAIYVAKGWYVTAFRYVRPAAPASVDAHGQPSVYFMVSPETGELQTVLTSKAVSISFATNEPIYPYLEPADAPEVPGRILDLFVVASQTMDGYLIDPTLRPWNADVAFASDTWRTTPSGRFDLMDTLFLDSQLKTMLPPGPRITHYVDHASKREASDVVFRPSASAKEVRPPPHVHHLRSPVPVPYELLPVGIAGIWWWRRKARKRPDRSEAGSAR